MFVLTETCLGDADTVFTVGYGASGEERENFKKY
jgi:hypothetical protein